MKILKTCFLSQVDDIETKSNILIRLPEKNISNSLNMSLNILNNDNKKSLIN